MKLDCDAFTAKYEATKGSGAILLDIRNDDEVAEGMLRGALHIPLPQLAARSTELPKAGGIFIYCRSGARAQKALELLNGLGFKNVVVAIDGGYATLREKL